MRDMKFRLRSLAVATPGWRAVYRTGNTLTCRQVMAWALIEDTTAKPRREQDMIGVVLDNGRPVFSDQIAGEESAFCGYAAPGDDLGSFDDDAGREPPVRSERIRRDSSAACSWFG
jgi:hypothetical protein